MSRSIIVLPDDSAKPILDAIAHAAKSIRIKMFIFSDPSLLQAVIAAQHRGVDVRIMLNPERRDGEKENNDARKTLTAAGVHVIDSNPNFDLTHEKSMVIDDETAFVQSLNWETKNLTVTRDYAVVTSHKHEVEEVAQCFDADWNRTKFDAGDHSHLIWCIGNGRERIGQFIDQSKHSLWLQNERYQDPVIIEHLIRAHTRGVKIHIMARPPDKLKKGKLAEGVSGLRSLQDVGAKVHKLKHIKLHAKLLLADDNLAIVVPSTLPPAASTAGVNSPFRSGMNTSLAVFTRRSKRTGRTRIPSISPMKDCLPSSRKTTRMLQKILLSKQANTRSTIEGR